MLGGLAFCVLLPGFYSAAQARAPLVSPAQITGPSIVLTMTVGIIDGECATSESVSVPANQTVYTCYRVGNTGNVSFTRHTLASSPYGPAFVDRELPIVSLEPGAELLHIESQSVTETRSIIANWTAINATLIPTSPLTARASDTISLTVLRPAAVITYTVGAIASECVPTSSVAINSGSLAAFCLQIGNSGAVTLSQHSISILSLGISTTINSELIPRQVITINESNRTSFGIANEMLIRNVTAPITSTVSIQSLTALRDSVRTTGTATVLVGQTGIKVDQTVSTDASSCAATDVTALPSGTTIYLCVNLTNSGTVPLIRHGLTLQQSGATILF